MKYFVVLILVCAVSARPQVFGNSASGAQSFNTGIGIPGLFTANFGASNAAAAANAGGAAPGAFGGSRSAAAAQSVGAGISVLGVPIGFNAANANSASNAFGLGR